MERVSKFLKDNKIKGKVVVATSGGPDSMMLLNILKNIEGIEVICAHVNHNVRKESEAEFEFVKKYCEDRNIPFEGMKIKEYTPGNFQDTARKIRYKFFEDVVKRYKAKCLATAHHGDDLIETIMMNIVRGSDLKGYAGFRSVVEKEGYKIIRPLIYFSKEEIYSYIDKYKIPYVIDESNAKDIYTRNRYRKELLPFLKKEEKNVHEKFLRFSETLLEYEAYLQTKALEVLKRVYVNENLDIKEFLKEDVVIQKKVLYIILSMKNEEIVNKITNKHIDSLLELASSKRANAYVMLPFVTVRKVYDKIVFDSKDKDDIEYNYELGNKIKIVNGKTIEMVDVAPDNSNNTLTLLREEISFPLYVRTRKEGDRIKVKGMDGTKKVKDIFIDEKISLKERESWPIVVDSSGNILWIPGLKKSCFDKGKNGKYNVVLIYY